MRGLLLGALILLLSYWPGGSSLAQTEDSIKNHPFHVFLRPSSATGGLDELIFVDLHSGEETVLTVPGERYTRMQREVIFFDRVNRAVQIATPDGAITPHPFITLPENAMRVDWIVSEDETMLAWTITTRLPNGGLATTTRTANIDGSQQLIVLQEEDVSDSPLRALPVAFSPDKSILYMDAHPDGLEDFVIFDQYVALFALRINDGTITPLPGEQGNCICGAAILGDQFLRLHLTDDLNAFDLHHYTLPLDTARIIPAIRLSNYDTAGDVIIAPDGTKAVYALARINNFGTTQQTIQSVLILVDLRSATQETVTRPISALVRPIAWSEDNSAIIFANPIQGKTWKLTLADQAVQQIASAIFLGQLD